MSALDDPLRLAALEATDLMDSGPEMAFDRLSRLVALSLKVPIAMFSLIDAKRQFLKSAYAVAHAGPARPELGIDASLCPRVVKCNRRLVVGDTQAVFESDFFRQVQAAAYAGVPLRIFGGQTIGVLSVIDVQPRLFMLDELELLEEFGRAVVAEIDAHRIHHTLMRNEAKVERLYQSVIRQLPNGAVLVFDRELNIVLADGPLVGRLSASRPLEGHPLHDLVEDADKHLVERMCRGALLGSPMDIDVDVDESRYGFHATPFPAEGDEPAGLVMVQDVTDRHRAQEELLRQSAIHAEELRALSLIDELTQLHNRRGLFTLGEQQMRVANRQNRPLLLLFADLNGMKGINDQLGHDEGDRALRDTAALLRKTFRESDILCRLGGDEFVVVCDFFGTSPQALQDRLRSNLAEHNETLGRRYRLSVSVGVAFYDPADPQPLADLLNRADQAMYHNKRQTALLRVV